VTHGLYAAHDFIGPDKKEEYTQLRSALRHELAPVTSAEHALVAEILHAKWRLRKCADVQARLAANYSADPGREESNRKTQASIVIARKIANLLLRRSMDEFRRLQEDRQLQIDAPEPSEVLPVVRNPHGGSSRRLLTFA
jgi:hypothetical protein